MVDITERAAPDPGKPAKRDLRTIDEPFYSLDKKTQKRLRKAAKRGWPVQASGRNFIWHLCTPSWLPHLKYRLDPTFTPPAKRVKPAPVVETITQHMRRSENGCLYSFRSKNGVPVTVTFTRTNGVIDKDSYRVEVRG